MVVFNGLSYPEAVVSTVARESGIRVVTYETGFREGSIFFSHGQATKYDIQVPSDFKMGEEALRAADLQVGRPFGKYAGQEQSEQIRRQHLELPLVPVSPFRHR